MYIYRHEKNPVPGRHDVIFPLFEFETRGNFEDLCNLVKELLAFLGFKTDDDGQFPGDDYMNVAAKYGVKELDHDHETMINEEYGEVFFLKVLCRICCATCSVTCSHTHALTELPQ